MNFNFEVRAKGLVSDLFSSLAFPTFYIVLHLHGKDCIKMSQCLDKSVIKLTRHIIVTHRVFLF